MISVIICIEGNPPHPDIGDYGDPDKREWKQYILS
ncbi:MULTISPECIES: YqcI/YcgG family protein [Geobacillus]|nr:hypothetical protein B1A75_02660 [Geobacillus sp. LEMMY01]